jgi:hypothetical protein
MEGALLRLAEGYFRLNDRWKAPVKLNVLSFNAFLPYQRCSWRTFCPFVREKFVSL